MTIIMYGSAYSTSTTRIIRSSMRPPRYPAVAPYVTPMTSDTSVEINPTISEMRPPSSTRARMSRPALSVPIGCVHENDPSGVVNGGIARMSAASRGM